MVVRSPKSVTRSRDGAACTCVTTRVLSPWVAGSALLVGLVVALAAGTGSAHAQSSSPPIMLVIDGSGSMWGSLGNKLGSKLNATQDAVSQSLIKLPATSRVGLVSYGNRRRGSCFDASVVTPLGPNTIEPIIAATKKLNPKGKGPLSLALQKVQEQLPEKGPASIIIVHDGPDNCGQDPCAVAKEIVAKNPAVSIDLISLALEPTDIPRVQCLPKIGGGKFYDARDPKAIVAAVDDAVMRASGGTSSRPVTAEGVGDGGPAAAPKKVFPGLAADAVLNKGGRQFAQSLTWRVTRADDPASTRTFSGARLALKLPPGDYDVAVSSGLVSKKTKLTLTEDKGAQSTIDLDAGLLGFANPAVQPGTPTGASPAPIIGLYAAADGADADKPTAASDDPIWLGFAPNRDLMVPAGRYVLKLERGMGRDSRALTVVAGGRQVIDTDMSLGTLKLTSVAAITQMPLRDVLYTVTVDDPFAPSGRREVARSSADPASFHLPAGTYQVVAKRGIIEKRDLVAVGTGAEVNHQVSMPFSKLAVTVDVSETTAQDIDGLLTRVLQTRGGRQVEIARSSELQPIFELPEGQYDIVVASHSGLLTASTTLKTKIGTLTTAKFRLRSGEVNIVPNTSGSGWASRSAWRILNAKGRTVVHSRDGRPFTTRLSPGTYEMIADGGTDVSRKSFTVEAGEATTLRVP